MLSARAMVGDCYAKGAVSNPGDPASRVYHRRSSIYSPTISPPFRKKVRIPFYKFHRIMPYDFLQATKEVHAMATSRLLSDISPLKGKLTLHQVSKTLLSNCSKMVRISSRRRLVAFAVCLTVPIFSILQKPVMFGNILTTRNSGFLNRLSTSH